MNWKSWLKGLAVAAVGGAAAGVVNATTAGQLNKVTGISAGVGALTTVLAYLVKSPITPAGPAPAVASEQPKPAAE